MLPLLVACNGGDIPMVNLGIDDTYVVERMRLLVLHPEFSGNSYVWTMQREGREDSIISNDRDLHFVTAYPGDYHLHLKINDDANPVDFDTYIKVVEEEVEFSPYISSVKEFCPAPGQFVNNLPAYEDGDDAEDMRKKAEESISGINDVMISLGGFGGYVTFSFDHTVVNIPGEYDFKIYGNAFFAADAKRPGGSSEPGIVEVSLDVNGNGIPDDPWYELAGSEYYKPETRHGYTVTYERTPEGHTAIPIPQSPIKDSAYIHWTDNLGADGYIQKNSYHSQDYYPRWIDSNTMTFQGTCVANNAIDESGIGRYYVQYCYDWGYVDNYPNNVDHKSCFNIDWAVDSLGNHVQLPGADFIRVYTGINQVCGWLGETSTELSKAEDLHLKPEE